MNADRPRYYHRDGSPIITGDNIADMLVWAERFEQDDGNRSVLYNERFLWRDEVSTIFLGLDHNFFGNGPPLIFETMVFHGGQPIYCERTSTEAEARYAHAHVRSLCWFPLWLRKRLFSGWF